MQDQFSAHPLTPARWDDFETLFGPQGACYGCWCTHFRIPPSLRKTMDGNQKKAFMKDRVLAGPPPGVLGYLDGSAAGWVQVGPRAEVVQWNSERTVSRPIAPSDADDPSIWAVSCFFIASKMRGKGVSHLLLEHAVQFARASGARLLEACPMDRARHSKSIGLYVGPSRIFQAAGFGEIARRKDGRPLVRLVL